MDLLGTNKGMVVGLVGIDKADGTILKAELEVVTSNKKINGG